MPMVCFLILVTSSPLICYLPHLDLGIEIPPKASSGAALPNARLISAIVIGKDDKPMTTATLALMQWGQFINHDFQSTAQFTLGKE